MKTTTVLAALLLATGTAYAGGQDGSIGAGVEFQQQPFTLFTGGGVVISTPIGGPSLNYDAGKFHVGGFLGLSDPGGAGNTDIAFGARFYYHVHSTAMSDFGVGAGLGIFDYDTGPGANEGRRTLVYLEPGIQIRAFIASNVALSFTAGLSIGAADADGVSLSGQATGAAGIHYYFF